MRIALEKRTVQPTCSFRRTVRGRCAVDAEPPSEEDELAASAAGPPTPGKALSISTGTRESFHVTCSITSDRTGSAAKSSRICPPRSVRTWAEVSQHVGNDE